MLCGLVTMRTLFVKASLIWKRADKLAYAMHESK